MTLSTPIVGWMVSLLIFIILIVFVFGMLFYLKKCISSVSEKYQDTADLSSSIALLEADKFNLEKYITEQKEELLKIKGEREEQESLRQEILTLYSRRAELESGIEGLIAMQVEKRELESVISEKREAIESLEEKYQEVIRLKETLPQIREEYDRLQKSLEKKSNIEFEINTAEQTLKFNKAQLLALDKEISEKKESIDFLNTSIAPLELKISELKSKCSDLMLEASTASRDKADAQAQHLSLTAQLLDLEKQTKQEKQACQETEESLKQLRKQQTELGNACQNLEKEIQKAEQQLSCLHTELAKGNAELRELNERLPVLRKEVQRLEMLDSHRDPESDVSLKDLLEKPASLIVRKFTQKKLDEKQCLQDFKRTLHGANLQFHERTINAFHTSLKCQDINPLTVLAGVSGTGKTLLPVKYAEFMGINQVILSVQPRWDSVQDLFGFYNYLEHRYKATELSRCLMRMDPFSTRFNSKEDVQIRNGLLMVLLDEMNLARPEYYFSEFLSKLELRRIVDANNKDSRNRAYIELDTGTEHGSQRIWIPNNIIFVGTMNEDESTQTLSDKVLDRANVLRFGRPSLRNEQKKPDMKSLDGNIQIMEKTWESWKKTDFHQYAEACSAWTKKLNDALAGIGRAFGFRVEEAIYSYVANYPGVTKGSTTMANAFADQVEQKILPKLRGCDMTMHASIDSMDMIEDVIKELDDTELLDAFHQARDHANETGIFLWQGVTRS